MKNPLPCFTAGDFCFQRAQGQSGPGDQLRSETTDMINITAMRIPGTNNSFIFLSLEWNNPQKLPAD